MSSSSSFWHGIHDTLEGRWKALVRSPWANRWLPEVRYLEGWELQEIAVLGAIGLLTSSWYTLRSERLRHERFQRKLQEEEEKEKDDENDNDETTTTKEQQEVLQRNGGGLLARVVGKQLFSPPVKRKKKDEGGGGGGGGETNDDGDNDDRKQAQWRWTSPSVLDSERDHRRLFSMPLDKSRDLARSLGFSVGSSWERRYQTLAMFSCSLAFVMPLFSLCFGTVLHFGFLLPYHVFLSGEYNNQSGGDSNNYVSFFQGILPDWYHPVWVAFLGLSTWAYLGWITLGDESPTRGSRRPWMRDRFGGWWSHACDYLPVVLVKTADLPAFSTTSKASGVISSRGTPARKTTITRSKANKYVLGYHPHGIIAVGAFCAFATDGARVLDLTKKHKDGNNNGDLPLRKSFLKLLDNSLRDPIPLSDKGDDDDDDDDDDSDDDDDDDGGGGDDAFDKAFAAGDSQKAPPKPPPPTEKTAAAEAPPARGFSTLFPDLDRRIVTLPINFRTPLLREYLLSMGAVTSEKETFRRYLGGGEFGRRKIRLPAPRAMVVVVGGAAESMLAHEGHTDLVLNHRRGFVREAILAGASLVPVIGFGETNLYTLYGDDDDDDDEDGGENGENGGAVPAVQKFVRKHFGFALPLFAGRSIFFRGLGVMPRRRPVVVVVGKPIPPPTLREIGGIDSYHQFHPRIDKKTDTPANEHGKILLEWHSRYVRELEELYREYKDAPWNGPGKRRQKSMKIVR